jgi:nitrogenase molybdenum-iron protein alpha/beta subunit
MSTLVVGTAECTYYSRGPASSRAGAGGENALNWSYSLSGNEMVFGCGDGLREAILEMLDLGAQPLMIIATCIPALMGEDIEGLCDQISRERGAKVFAVSIPHYSCVATSRGTSAALTGIIKIMESAPKDPKRINLIYGERGSGVFYEMTELLQAAGYRLVNLGNERGVEDYITAPSAALSLICSQQAAGLAAGMKEKFGVDFIDMSELLSAEDIAAAFKKIEAVLGIRTPDYSKKYSEIKELEQKASKTLKGKRFIMAQCYTTAPIRTAEYLTELGLIPVFLGLDDIFPEEQKYRKFILDSGANPIVAHMVSEPIEREFFAEFGADIILGAERRGHGGGSEELGFGRAIAVLNACLSNGTDSYTNENTRRFGGGREGRNGFKSF